MATIENNERKPKKGVRRLNKKSTRVDLTPMVDLGFLLLTFFVFTTSMTIPQIMPLNVPKDDPKPTLVCESCVLTLVPGSDDSIVYFEGSSSGKPTVHGTSYSPEGLRADILKKKRAVEALNDPIKEIVLVVKPGDWASYKNFVDIMDEIQITGVDHYFVGRPDDDDKKLLPGLWK